MRDKRGRGSQPILVHKLNKRVSEKVMDHPISQTKHTLSLFYTLGHLIGSDYLPLESTISHPLTKALN